MNASTIAAHTNAGRTVHLPGAPSPVPGLWVAVWNDAYVIVHQPTRSRLSGGFTDPEAALAAVIDLGALAEWATECDQMRLTRQVINQIDATVRRWGGSSIDIRRKKR